MSWLKRPALFLLSIFLADKTCYYEAGIGNIFMGVVYGKKSVVAGNKFNIINPKLVCKCDGAR